MKYTVSFCQFVGLMMEYGEAKAQLSLALDKKTGVDYALRTEEETRIALGEYALRHWKEMDDDHNTQP